MKEKNPINKERFSELQATIKELFSKFEELRGFL